MKKHLLLLTTLLISVTSCAQNGYREKTVFRNADIEIHQIDEHTWHANGHLMYNESMYLIEGEDKALLLDAGTTIPGLRKIMENIVHKPVILAATHVHPDHTGSAICEWDTIWINAADLVNAPEFMPDYHGTILYMEEGQIFDLGGRQIQVVFTPGHTPGSTTFIDVERHYGFSADAFGSNNLLVLTSLSTVISSCQRLERFITRYDIRFFYPGHYFGNNPETPQRIRDVADICEDILAGRIDDNDVKAMPNPRLPHAVTRNGVTINYADRHIQ